MKPILCLDFDGVCHSYTSGWQGADVISDPPVQGLFQFLDAVSEHFTIYIYSSRSHQDGGIPAMMDWFNMHAPYHLKMYQLPDFEVRVDDWGVVLYFPREKPAAQISIDDRAITFEGTWPDVDMLVKFKPWNKREK